ncbi:Fe-S cluster assembly iron-binding protein IscA [Paramicrobacterium humi]|uniref:Fe-S cluster assembly iron-binding protein IscA n=1 Tax=Paramicrobacterium humi TaxID=640635 RepID=A0A1H4MGR4_9MICO|nr:Fe-S cluster assembly protein HesB [Microbacterium humi]SEB82256.1 Fe-S cluster assembly iron-binding protein IscA [Microbacterium humi]
MLTLTENASTIVKTIAAQSTGDDDAGLRISSQTSDAGDFAVDVAAAPESTDQVVESGGARVFLEETAAAALDDKILDADVNEQGAVRFSIGNQQPA